MKTCLMCNITKEENEFYKIQGKRLHSYCKSCKLEVDRKWRNTHHHECKSYNESRRNEKNVSRIKSKN